MEGVETVSKSSCRIIPRRFTVIVLFEQGECQVTLSPPRRKFVSALGTVIEKVLLEYGIKLHPSRRMKEYLDEGVGE